MKLAHATLASYLLLLGLALPRPQFPLASALRQSEQSVVPTIVLDNEAFAVSLDSTHSLISLGKQVHLAFGISRHTLAFTKLDERGYPKTQLYLRNLSTGVEQEVMVGETVIKAAWNPATLLLAVLVNTEDGQTGLRLYDASSGRRTSVDGPSAISDVLRWVPGTDVLLSTTENLRDEKGGGGGAETLLLRRVDTSGRVVGEEVVDYSALPTIGAQLDPATPLSQKFDAPAGSQARLRIEETGLVSVERIDGQNALREASVYWPIADNEMIVRLFDNRYSYYWIDLRSGTIEPLQLGTRGSLDVATLASSPFKLPWPSPLTRSVTCGNNGDNCHNKDHDRWAYDFAGGPASSKRVLASAGGTVISAVESVTCNSGSPKCVLSASVPGSKDYYSAACTSTNSNGGWGNLVILSHANGLYTKYTHLASNQVWVNQDQVVPQGFHLGDEGHTGYTVGYNTPCGDHVHFQEQQGGGRGDWSRQIHFVESNSPLPGSVSSQNAQTTSVGPTVTTSQATGIGQTSASLNATVNPNGSTTTLYFDYGLTSSYVATVTHGSVGSGTSALARTSLLPNLTCGTTYHYRARAESSVGVSTGGNQSFTTSACSVNRPTVTSVSPNTLPQGTPSQQVTVNGANFTVNSRHRLSVNGGQWFAASTAPTFVSGNALSVWINRENVQTTGIQVCADQSYSLCSTGSASVAIQPVTASYTINVSASPSAGGTVTGSGTFTAGSSRSVTATAHTGFAFSNWTENGNVVSTSATYSFNLTASRTLIANFTTNASPAQMSSPAPGSTLTSTTVQFQWTGGTGVSKFWLYVGTTRGGEEIYSQDRGTNLTAAVPGLPTDGRTVYVRLWSLIGGNWQIRDYTYTSTTLTGIPAEMVTPAPGSTLSASTVQFQWSGGSAVSKMWLYVGRTKGGYDLFSEDRGTNLSATVSGLPTDGTTIHVRLWSLIHGNWQIKDYAYTSATTVGVPAEMLTPAPGSSLAASTVQFQWSGGTGVSKMWLYVGTSKGAYDLADRDVGTSLSASITGLPTNGSTIHVRLWSLINGTWRFRDYGYSTASNAVAAEMASPAPGSTLTSSTVQFQWSGGTGVSRVWLYVGSSRGAHDLFDQDRGTSLNATVSGLPTDGRTVHVRLWSLIGGAWQIKDYTYTATTTAPAAAEMVSPAPGSTLTSSTVAFQWTGGTNVSRIWLYVGRTPGGFDLYDQDRALNVNATVSGLPTDGSKIYARLWSRIGSNWHTRDYVYTSGTTASAAAEMTTPAPGSTLTSSTVQFQWTGGAGVSKIWLYVGTTRGGYDLFDQDRGTSLNATVSGLPTNGRIVYIRLWSLIGGAWQIKDYTYTAMTGLLEDLNAPH